MCGGEPGARHLPIPASSLNQKIPLTLFIRNKNGNYRYLVATKWVGYTQMRIQRGLGVAPETPCAGFAVVGCSYGRLKSPNLMKPK